ncbi:DUF2000 domain-containing protein [Domibacillus sp. DTU_2020_1001157_1_SI_ALB_TIR_016]|uniref:DUF2000 domain-containing protein n=1 Tax=Domibacillus sp. DTU_2020_1001157_1_SI_ALB_TIR_016 TaxID=3077789 RepID=UPI0028E54637|nr:DUF2000 domain-containing protein [Domibacillus sp. DTU_2020_1001157_1_SI_ALB_TIR_016]WNS79050.1 DUF2000 domain-containing protein [Domibacillus sp. DTU_2020_1001157_1_SI_ALB_TIR_016]
MSSSDEMKSVLVIDEELPVGLIANTSAILGITLGKYAPEMVGESVVDESGVSHLGIVTTPIPILKGNAAILQELRARTWERNFEDVIVVGFAEIAQRCKTYEEYRKKLAKTSVHSFYGLGFWGEKRKINKLTGSLPLLR